METTGSNGTDERRVVDLGLPSDSSLLRVVRLSATALATTVGMAVEDLDELRIAGDGTRLELRFALERDCISLEGTVPAGGPIDPDRLDLSQMLLAAVTDEHTLETTDGAVRVTFVKRASGLS